MHRTALALALVASLVGIADAKPRRPPRKTHDSAWMKACIHERTGPDGGISQAEARRICKAEEPEDEIAAAKAQLTLAKLNARVAKAKARVAKALEACEQAVVDRCVELAPPDGSRDCTDESLRNEFNVACLGQEGK